MRAAQAVLLSVEMARVRPLAVSGIPEADSYHNIEN